MNYNLSTLTDVRKLFRERLRHLYPVNETDAIASLIIRTILNTDRLQELMNPSLAVPPAKGRKILKICDELSAGKPVQYILGETEFYGCRLKVNRYTLIPRRETEELTDLVIKENRAFGGMVLDIGTGPGTIAIPVALNIPACTVHALDFSETILKTARENAVLNKALVFFYRADILNPGWKPPAKYGIIISNPPYVPENERKNMHINVTKYEPAGALFVPDDDPLMFYRAIVRQGGELMLPGAKIYFEIHEMMGDAIKNLLTGEGFSNIRIIKDLNGRDRIVTCTYHDKQ